MLFVEYPKCTTCIKAKKWLIANNFEITSRNIVTENPTASEIALWYKKSGLPLKKFFNTSGLIYKEQKIKDKLPTMSEEEQIELLATNGMLVKRPILVSDDFVTVGFNETVWSELLK